MIQARNRLVVIGPLSDRVAYLNVPRDEAIRRWMQAQSCFEGDTPAPPPDDQIREFDFDDFFRVYEASPPVE